MWDANGVCIVCAYPSFIPVRLRATLKPQVHISRSRTHAQISFPFAWQSIFGTFDIIFFFFRIISFTCCWFLTPLPFTLKQKSTYFHIFGRCWRQEHQFIGVGQHKTTRPTTLSPSRNSLRSSHFCYISFLVVREFNYTFICLFAQIREHSNTPSMCVWIEFYSEFSVFE